MASSQFEVVSLPKQRNYGRFTNGNLTLVFHVCVVVVKTDETVSPVLTVRINKQRNVQKL